ncbi:hypothetical protein SAMN05444266_10971 [Chitinophaga jiangningensis]|uniref:Uncharacterized protein n=1 Tax=Chitinophaga jiangningensis TaxID=1419482 RepID=A0A1M7JYH9_9BACT|nr:hypothetical protein [Chitinophaga jiangningensis]SHM58048.1 hypothetical protein SAMN05444266_10971 [Chitinophaga jiangningensis]
MKRTIIIVLFLFAVTVGAMVMTKTPASLFAKGSESPKAYAIAFMAKPPHDVALGADDLTLAQFAWNEFLALNWRSSYFNSGRTYQRGEPDYGWSYSSERNGYPDLAVWETYNHRVELRPGNDNMLPFDKIPNYSYTKASFTPDIYTDAHLFHNLDENNEIGSCNMYAHTNLYGQKQQILFQAKVNRSEYEYIRKYYNTAAKLKAANINTYRNIQAYNQYFKGGTSSCDCPESEKVVCLPCGTGSNASGSKDEEGAIEVKTAWRKLLPEDGAADTYFKRKVITYRQNPDGTTALINDTYLLIGIHIIHKTRNYPNFIFATWEHEDVTKPQQSIGYVKLDDSGREYGGLIVGYPRVHDPIQATNQANYEAHRLLRSVSTNSVWQHYNLIGVQAQTTNNSNSNNFFLANYVIESDTTLQIFRGSSINTPIDSGVNIIYNGKQFSMGGCQGCHGVAQFRLGADCSFVCDTVNKPVDKPDIGQNSDKRLRYERAFRKIERLSIK